MSEVGVGVVIPVRDGAAFLSQALNSVLEQQPSVAQVVVVDDHSQDQSAELARSYGGVVQVVSNTGRGIAAAVNTGVALIDQPVLSFVDADDIWTPGRLAHLLRALEQAPDSCGVHGHQQIFMDGALDNLGRPEPALIRGTLLLRSEDYRRVGACADLEFGEFIEWASRAQDMGLTWQQIPEVVLWRRSHDANVTRQKPRGADYLRVVKAILDRRRQQGEV